MKIVFFGSDDFGVPTLEALVAQSGRHALVGVVSQPDRPAGRGRKLHPTPVSAWARLHGLPLICPERINAPEAAATALGWGGEIGVVIAFGQKIGNAILDAIPHGCINLHSSLLPKYRGAAPIARAIIGGESESGLTVFRLVEKMDAGPVAYQKAMAILPTETTGELRHRLAAAGPEAILATLDAIERGEARFVPQDDSVASSAPKLSHADSAVDWNQPAETIAARIRGLYPWPGAKARFVSQAGRAEEVVLARAVAESGGSPDSTEPGTLRKDLAVAAGRGAVRLLEIKPVSHRLMSFNPDFVNGRRVRPGDRFANVEWRVPNVE